MNNYTVIGYYEENGQIFSHHVVAFSIAHSFFVASEQFELEDANFVTSIEGHVVDGKGIGFPGESVVDGETIINSPDVYNNGDDRTNLTSKVLADFDIKDWRVSEDQEESMLKEHLEIYRFVIEQSQTSNAIFFKVYPKSLVGIDQNVTQNGISGVIEIRNGKPGMSLGLSEDDVILHIDSDVSTGLHVHHDRFAQPDNSVFYSHSHDLNFESLYYHTGDETWLNNAQKSMVEKIFSEFDFGELVVSETGNWCNDDNNWSLVIFFENDGGDSLAGKMTVTFYADSIFVNNIESQLP
jgi:hypothetical protein